MKDIFFYNNFNFNSLTFKKYKHTDSRTGSPIHYLAYMIKGHAKIVSEDMTIEIYPCDLFYIPKGLPYQSYWDSQDEIQFLSFGFHHFPEANSKQFLLQKINCDNSLKEEIKKIPIIEDIDSYVIGAFYSSLHKVIPHLKYNPNHSKREIIEKAKRYIYDNINCSVTDIATHCLISKSALYYIFKTESDITPNELIQKIRCTKAEVLLTTTDKSVQEISEILEFSSASYFRKIIKIHTGKTPREIRNNAKGI